MNHQSLNDVIYSCQSTINTLYQVAQQVHDPRVRNKLSESAHHLRHCIEDCRFAAQKIQQFDFTSRGEWGLGMENQIWGMNPYQTFSTPGLSPMKTQVQSPVFV